MFLDRLQWYSSVIVLLLQRFVNTIHLLNHNHTHRQELMRRISLMMKDRSYSITSIICKVHVAMNSIAVHPTNTTDLQNQVTDIRTHNTRVLNEVRCRVYLTWIRALTADIIDSVVRRLEEIQDTENTKIGSRLTRDLSEQKRTYTSESDELRPTSQPKITVEKETVNYLVTKDPGIREQRIPMRALLNESTTQSTNASSLIQADISKINHSNHGNHSKDRKYHSMFIVWSITIVLSAFIIAALLLGWLW